MPQIAIPRPVLVFGVTGPPSEYMTDMDVHKCGKGIQLAFSDKVLHRMVFHS